MRKKKTFIHVNQHVIRANMKHKKNDPVITVKSGKENTYCHEVAIIGNSKVNNLIRRKKKKNPIKR